MPPWKRAVDVVGAALGILVTLPLSLLAAAAIRFSSKGPVFFTQVRVTQGGRPFRCLKFRTMVVNAAEIQKDLRNEQTGPVFKMRRDPRVTRVGHWLRRTSIDELPQLWNVLRGELSLVGPRPPTPEEVSTYLPWQWERLHVTPGLTCYWQVGGRSEIGFLDWVRMDIRYARRLGFWTDLGILLRTVPAVLSGRGAY
jgi:lipopolysaccharide/colanic/teichoic acid biosynthesis glycosyltransferase